MAKKILILFSIITTYSVNYAQDIHFSQYFNTPLLTNPALTGNFKGSNRFILNYKDQWGSLTKNSYKTLAFSYDRSVYKNKFFSGLHILSDKAGDANMGLTQIALYVASKVKIHTNDYLKVGIQGAWSQHSYNFETLTWNSQFDGILINQNINSSEISNHENLSYIDFSTGMLWTHIFEQENQFNLGFSAFHITKPKYYSFLSNEEIYVRWVLHADYSIPVVKNILLLDPYLLMIIQGPSKEMFFGMSAKYFYETNTRLIDNPSYVCFGAYYRNKDAIIVNTRFNYKSLFDLDLSYDINISSLYTSTKARGGMEISIIYTIPEKKSHKKRY